MRLRMILASICSRSFRQASIRSASAQLVSSRSLKKTWFYTPVDQMALAFSMVIGERAETVVVVEGPGVLQTESAQIKDVIENQQVVDLPGEGPRVS